MSDWYTADHVALWDAIDKYSDCPRGSIARALARQEVELSVARVKDLTPPALVEAVFTRGYRKGHDDAIARAANTVDYMAEHDHDFDPAAYSDAIRSMPVGQDATRERERWIFRRGISVATGDLIGADDETADREIAKCPL